MHTFYTALRADRPQLRIAPIALTWSSDSVGVSAMERNSVFSRWRAMATYIRLYSVGPDFSRERAENPCRGRARLGALEIPEPVKAKARAPLKNLAASPKIFGLGFFADRRASVERPGVMVGDRGRLPSLLFQPLLRRLSPVRVSAYVTAPRGQRWREEGKKNGYVKHAKF